MRIIYTTNAIEALNSKLRRAVRTRGHFPGDGAAMKLPISGVEQRRRGMETSPARVGGPLSSVVEPLAEDDGELCLCPEPFPGRPSSRPRC